VVVVERLSNCAVVRTFRVRGRRGINRVSLRTLRRGTYRVTAKAGSRVAARARVVVIARGRMRIRRVTHAWQPCAAQPSDVTRLALAAPPTGTAAPPPAPPKPKTIVRRTSDALGAVYTKSVDLVESVPPFLYAILGFAIALLALAVLPIRAAPNLRVAALLAYHRELFVLLGTVALIGTAITYALW
jgi:hypothetical protein